MTTYCKENRRIYNLFTVKCTSNKTPAVTDSGEYERTLARFDRIVGCGHIFFFHLNDSRKGLGSRVDRHEHIGQGAIGLDTFGLLLNDSRFRNLPMTLETPKGEDVREDKENLDRLRALIS